MTTFVPRESDKTWTRLLLAQIKQGGLWGLPMSGDLYEVDHIGKMVILIKKGDGAYSDMHERVSLVMESIGWHASIRDGVK